MEEIWLDIKNYEGIYKVSNFGRILNSRGMILKPLINRLGYASVILCNKTDRKQFKIHRLVGFVFIPNDFNLPEINHKDENKLNNKVENLEWCGRLYNANYGTAKERNCKPLRKAVVQYDLYGNLINKYESIKDATKSGCDCGAISRCINGIYKQTKGFIWRKENEKIPTYTIYQSSTN